MLGGDKIRGSPEGSRAFVHFYDFRSVPDVGPRAAAASAHRLRAGAADNVEGKEESNQRETHIILLRPRRRSPGGEGNRREV